MGIGEEVGIMGRGGVVTSGWKESGGGKERKCEAGRRRRKRRLKSGGREDVVNDRTKE